MQTKFVLTVALCALLTAMSWSLPAMADDGEAAEPAPAADDATATSSDAAPADDAGAAGEAAPAEQ